MKSLTWIAAISFTLSLSTAAAYAQKPGYDAKAKDEETLWKEENAKTQQDLLDEIKQAKYPLTDAQGPWMIKVASFEGNSAFEHANDLCMELRNRWKIEAYVCNFQPANQSQMTEKYKKEFEEKYDVKPRIYVPLNKGERNYAVFAGNFEDDDGSPDKSANKLLRQIRGLKPNAVPQSVWDIMRFKKNDNDRNADITPFKSAMLVWNPVRPKKLKSALSKKELQILLAMNENTPYSAYEIKGKFTMKVAEFRGASLFYVKGMKNSKSGEDVTANEVEEKFKFFQKNEKSPLKVAGENACAIAHELRKNGYDAYVFHGLYGSMVCIGSYESVADPNIATHKAEYKKVRLLDNFTLEPDIISVPRKPTQADMMAN